MIDAVVEPQAANRKKKKKRYNKNNARSLLDHHTTTFEPHLFVRYNLFSPQHQSERW
jgi:hypothetical protein